MEGKQANKKHVMECMQAYLLRDLVANVNSLGIKKEDIITLFKEDDGFFLVYYT